MDDYVPLSPPGCLGNTIPGKSILAQNEIPDRNAAISHNSLITQCPGIQPKPRAHVYHETSDSAATGLVELYVWTFFPFSF